jgi:hypothetical protein
MDFGGVPRDFFRQPGDFSPIHSGIFWGSDFGPENTMKRYTLSHSTILLR